MKLILETWRKYFDEIDTSDNFSAEELVNDYDESYNGDEPGIGFFLSLVRAAPGTFLPHREQELAEEMRQAVANILRNTHGN
jgi:hypothetical protein